MAWAVPRVLCWDGDASQCDSSRFCWWELRPQDCPLGLEGPTQGQSLLCPSKREI